LNFSDHFETKEEYENKVPAEVMPLKTEIIAKIIRVTKKKPIRISLGDLDSYFKDGDDREEMRSKGLENEAYVSTLWSSI